MNLIHNKRKIIRCHPRPIPIPHFPHPRAFRTIKSLTNSPSITHRAEWLHAPLTNTVVLGFCTPGNRIGVFAVQSWLTFCSRYGHSTKLFFITSYPCSVTLLTFQFPLPTLFSWPILFSPLLSSSVTCYSLSAAPLTFQSPPKFRYFNQYSSPLMCQLLATTMNLSHYK